MAFALAALLPVIIIFYLLRLRRVEHPVSSTYLWQRMVRDMEANTPWQRLRSNLLMFLQLLFLIILIIAIARPTTPAAGITGPAATLIIDTSASMAADDVTPSRLEAAKDQAHRLVDSLPGSTRLTIIAAGDKARVATSATTDRLLAHQAIDALQAGAGGSDMQIALQLASALAKQQPNTQTIILSDGNVTIPRQVVIPGQVQFAPIGLEGENQAIALLNLQPAPGNAPDRPATAFAQVINYGRQPIQRRIAFYADGALFNTADLDLPPSGEQPVVVDGVPPEARRIEARLLPLAAGRDYLPADDSAMTIQRPCVPTSINLLSSGNLFLETALSLLPCTQAQRFDPGSENELPGADLTILDNHLPVTATLPSGSLFFIAPLQSTPYFTITGVLDNPVPQPASSAEPLLHYVSLDTIHILNAARIPLPDGARPIIVAQDPAGGEIPLLFISQAGGRRVAVLAFDLLHSDLPLSPSFPILLANLVEWLAPGRNLIPAQVAPGSTIDFTATLTETIITYPDGHRNTVQSQNGRFVFDDTNQLGVYQVDLGGEAPIEFAANLFSSQESRLSPGQTLAVTGTAAQAGAGQPGQRDWWRIPALLAIIVLFAEWLVYHRATLAMLYQRLYTAVHRLPRIAPRA